MSVISVKVPSNFHKNSNFLGSDLFCSKDATPSPLSAYTAYFHQSSLRAAVGLALLYMTVLGFDNLALSYGASQGMSASTLGSFRSLGSLLGLLGALSYTTLERNIGLLWTGLIGLTLQNIFINLCSVSIFLPGSPFNITGYFENLTVDKWLSEVKISVTEVDKGDVVSPLSLNQLSPSILVFFCGITLARYGLWIADPSITQIMQETIPEAERYSVFGAQTSICEMFSVIKDLLVIALPDTANFGFLVLVSCCFVFAGYVLFFSYFTSTCSCRRRKSKTTGSEMAELHSPEKKHLIEKKIVENALACA
uniref:Solute carrier family 40 member n=1 Tax=Heterorhabditis bacteriophora TaxID=37862 RepID=A0A1I7X5V7_HETBA